MATLQRSTVFRRQGSSGVAWEDKCFLKEDKVDYKELRPVVGVTDPSNLKAAAPAAFPRSYSTSPMNQSSKAFGKPLGIPKSKSIRRKLLSNLLFSNKLSAPNIRVVPTNLVVVPDRMLGIGSDK
ncbi:hypothetical protein POTOM_026407 [Populus tomentosa]|uniref:Uncharacterized protein n=1 Tax=Populus tomentosa TaxID=118781 RepID=A0A8X7ZQV8_POPTO|nr:hypothetical protein POTOM_026407 [Populus tomentosa]